MGYSLVDAHGRPRQFHVVQFVRLPPPDRCGERVEYLMPAVVVVGVDQGLLPRPLQRVPPALLAYGTAPIGISITAERPAPWGCGCLSPDRGTRRTS